MLTAPDVAAPTGARRRAFIWLAAALVLTLAGTGAVIAANATVFGAASFVRIYLDALARGDAAEALALAGVASDDVSPDTTLLSSAALAPFELGEVRETASRDGRHEVTATWTVGTEEHETRFTVERVGTTAGLFASWAFFVSPLATLDVTLEHEDRVQVNDLDLVTASITAAPHRFAVFVPSRYTLQHDSRWLTSDAVTVTADQVGTTLEAAVDVRANEDLLAEVDRTAREFLDDCAAQRVLFPPGCPFGETVNNRVLGEPVWSIDAYPEITIVGTSGEPRWHSGPDQGIAQVTVEVQSIFDGSVETLERNVRFPMEFEIHISRGDRLTLVTVDPYAG